MSGPDSDDRQVEYDTDDFNVERVDIVPFSLTWDWSDE